MRPIFILYGGDDCRDAGDTIPGVESVDSVRNMQSRATHGAVAEGGIHSPLPGAHPCGAALSRCAKCLPGILSNRLDITKAALAHPWAPRHLTFHSQWLQIPPNI